MTDTPASAIACIGWGSLVRDPGELPCRGSWHDDGPALPVEFARESNAKKNQRGDKITLVICKITLVICPESVRVRTYWISLDLPDLTAARKCLATRERIPKNWETDVGFVDFASGQAHGLEADTITKWGSTRGLSGVVWTNLPCKFNGQQAMPSETEVVAFLRALNGPTRAAAERYVRRAPAQINTPYRHGIERELGWLRQD